MFAALVVCLAGPWLEDPPFPRAVQERALRSTVRVVTSTGRGQGSGVIIKYQRPFVYVLTAAHVVDGVEFARLDIYPSDTYPKPQRYCGEARVFIRAADEDVAVLRGIAEAPPAVSPLVRPADLPKGIDIPVFTAGCSRGDEPTLLADRLLGAPLVRKPDGSKAIYWKSEETPVLGRSGGPLFDSAGRVLGICSGTPEKNGFYSHARELHKVFRLNVANWLYDEDPM